MRCGKASEGRRAAPQLSVDEQGQIAIKLGWLLVAKATAGRRHKNQRIGQENIMRADGNTSLTRHALAFVLAGGRGSRLMELTDRRAKPAVYFGGKSRIIDFALSNAMNSGIRRIAVATQYKAHSLIRHLQMGWNFFRPERNESFDILPASQRVSETNWYLGTADAIYQNIDIIDGYGARYIVVLAGDHVYKMDYEFMLQQHVQQRADVTIGCLEMPRAESSGFGIMHVDDKDVILSFLEKPADPPAMPGKPDKSLASMGIYVFDTKFLFEELRRDANDPNSSHDFGKDIIPHIVKHGRAVAHQFSRSCVRSGNDPRSYWRDVGTVDAYWASNIDLTDILPELDLYDRSWPIWTHAEITPPAKFVHDEEGRRGEAVTSLVSGGCIISGASLRRSLLFTGVHLHSWTKVENAVILPYVDVGEHAQLANVVIDRGVQIPAGLVVGEDPELDAKRFRVTDQGICLITQVMIDGLAT
jgi:glucose-1-phosphate adenylyltransferase